MLSYRLQLVVLIAGLGIACAQDSIFTESEQHPAIGYDVLPVHDPIAALNTRLARGQVQLAFEGASGYLRSVLSALDVPVESQIAVFAKNSLQARIISPENPRTIFFNDSVAIGWVPGEPFVEVAAQDPQQGVIFYTLDQQAASQPQFVRADSCLQCHIASATLGVPGMLLRSVFPDPKGLPERSLGFFDSDQRSPLKERWGGWYVTGNTGALQHMGNRVYTDPSNDAAQLRIAPKLSTDLYLSGYSDVVALMVFDHQMYLTNLLTRFGWQIRVAAHDKQTFGIDSGAQEIVDYLLFTNEAPFEASIEGTSGFIEKFSASGIRDTKGRSLHDFDLRHRLMRYPCSYMMYSAAFDGLPTEGRAAIYKLLWQVLSGQRKDGNYSRLSASDRQAVIEILLDTKRGLPNYFQPLKQNVAEIPKRVYAGR
jgi:hypothetical protein